MNLVARREWLGWRSKGRKDDEKPRAQGGESGLGSAPVDVPTRPDLHDPQFASLFEGDASPSELHALLDVAKFQVDFQLRMAERLDSKARGLVGITALFAGAVQAFALREDVVQELSALSRVGLILAAAVAAGLLCIAFVLTAQSVILRGEREIEPEVLMTQLNPALQGDRRVTAELVFSHLDLAYQRKQINDERASSMRNAERFCLATLGVAGVEFVVAILTLL